MVAVAVGVAVVVAVGVAVVVAVVVAVGAVVAVAVAVGVVVAVAVGVAVGAVVAVAVAVGVVGRSGAMNGNGSRMVCAACGAKLNGIYRIVAFDVPRINVPTCGGPCRAEVKAWTPERMRLHVAGQATKGTAHANHR